MEREANSVLCHRSRSTDFLRSSSRSHDPGKFTQEDYFAKAEGRDPERGGEGVRVYYCRSAEQQLYSQGKLYKSPIFAAL